MEASVALDNENLGEGGQPAPNSSVICDGAAAKSEFMTVSGVRRIDGYV